MAKAVAVYGTALTTMYAAPELQASIVSITFGQASVSFGASGVPVAMNAAGLSAILGVNNNSSYGKNIYNNGGANNLRIVASSNFISPSAGSTANPGAFISNSANAGGIQFIAFQSGSNVGWFQVNLGGSGGAVTFGTGEFGNAGETLHVGGTSSVPEPSTLGLMLLALGAAGVRRRKKNCELAVGDCLS